MVTRHGELVMAAILIWSLMDIESPRIITSDMHVIDLLETDSSIWETHISIENKQRVIGEVHRWQDAVLAGADAIQAYDYAVGGAGTDFRTWLTTEKEAH